MPSWEIDSAEQRSNELRFAYPSRDELSVRRRWNLLSSPLVQLVTTEVWRWDADWDSGTELTVRGAKGNSLGHLGRGTVPCASATQSEPNQLPVHRPSRITRHAPLIGRRTRRAARPVPRTGDPASARPCRCRRADADEARATDVVSSPSGATFSPTRSASKVQTPGRMSPLYQTPRRPATRRRRFKQN
jgi:hypothetical protein